MYYSKLFQLSILLCGVGVSYLAFINNFKNDFKKQLSELIKKENGNYCKNIRIDYRLFAYILFRIGKGNWLEVFNPTSEITKRLEYDKSIAIRGLIFTCLSTIIGFLLIIMNE